MVVLQGKITVIYANLKMFKIKKKILMISKKRTFFLKFQFSRRNIRFKIKKLHVSVVSPEF